MPESVTNQQLLTARLSEAKSLFDAQDFRSAEQLVGDILKSDGGGTHEAWFLLSQINAARGLPGRQVTCLEKALAISPGNNDYLAFLAQARLSLGELDEAAELAGSALMKAGNSTETLDILGQVFHSVGQYSQSVQAFQESVDIDNNVAATHYGLGVSLALDGRISEAKRAYRCAIQLDPGHAKAWPALSKISRATKEQNHVEKLKELAVKVRNPWLAINVYHGLAKEFDDLECYTEAFSALATGKKRLVAVCPHDPFAGARKVRELSKFYADLDVERVSNSGCPDSAPIFVVGMPRTGTTVVERILTNHPDVTTIGERPQFSLLLKEKVERPGSGIVEAEALRQAWEGQDLKNLGQRYLESVAYLAGNSKHFVDKLPLNVLYAGMIMSALPEAKVVCLVRNPCDTVIGNFRQVFEYATGLYAWSLDLEALARFTVEFTLLVKTLQRKFPTRFHVVRYESLVSAPLQHSREMFGFCGLDWKDSFAEIHKNTLPVGTASTFQVQEPIHTRFTDRSKNYAFCLDGVKKIFTECGVDYEKDCDDRL